MFSICNKFGDIYNPMFIGILACTAVSFAILLYELTEVTRKTKF